MLRRLDGIDTPVRFRLDGVELIAQAGDSVAAALLGNGVDVFRLTPVAGAPRAPFCMIGQCFDCLVEIDGRPNRQACMTIVAEGMVVRPQRGARGEP